MATHSLWNPHTLSRTFISF